MVEFQQGMTLLVSAASGLIGAGFCYGLLKGTLIAKEKIYDKQLSDIEKKFERVVFTDTCNMCKVNNANQFNALKDSMDRVDTNTASLEKKVDTLLDIHHDFYTKFIELISSFIDDKR